MGSKWKKVRNALSSNLCIHVPTVDHDVSPPRSERFSDVSFLSPVAEQLSWSPALRLSKSLSRSSKGGTKEYGCDFFLWKEERLAKMTGSLGALTPPTHSARSSITPTRYTAGPSTSSPGNTECSNCIKLNHQIMVLNKMLEVYMHPDKHTTDSAALFHDLYNNMLGDMGNLRMQKCTICLASMKRGEGQAIFTAECSHSFHFQCIASNVKHGNQICPVCRAKWREVPVQKSTGLEPALERTRTHPVNWPQDNNPVMTVIRQIPQRQTSNRRISAPIFPVDEPSVFNDDEPLNLQNLNKSYSSSDESSFKRVLLKTYTEVPAVPRLTVINDFTVLINLKAPVLMNQTPRASVDLVTVLDISGSMAGTKLALLKRAMGFVIQNLGPADRLSVIAFSSTSRRLFPLRKMSDTGKQHALQAVNSLVANGGTNIAEGLRKGGKVMEDRREKNPVASIILLSDGQDTYTISSRSNSGSGQNQSNHHLLLPQGIKVPVHAFGFGTDHDASSMHSISEVSGGTFSFIETESVIQDAFAQCIGGLLSVVVKGLQVIIETANQNIQLRSLKAGSYKNHLMPDRKSGCVDVGDLYADEERDFLVSVNIPKETGLTLFNETLLLKVNCYYNHALTKETVKLVSEDVTIKRPENVGKDIIVSIEVDRQRNRLQSAEAMVQARTLAENGDLTRAVSTLESFRKVLSETISAKSGDRLCMALDAELKEMQDRMASRQVYEASGRAYILSGLSSHSWQRATARGDSTDGSSLVQAYQTPSMTEMLTRSQANLVQPNWSSFVSQPRPR